MASIYDDWMRTRSEEGDGSKEQAALLSYLNGATTANEAAHDFTRQANTKDSADFDWSLLIDAAKEFPQAHQKLVELLDAFAKLPEEETVAELRESRDFVFELHDAFNGVESASQSSHSTVAKEHHYINLCAFIACYWHHKHGEWTNWAMELSHNALEDTHRGPLINLFGQAVAQLFLFSGQEMYASSNATESSRYFPGPLLLKERQNATVSRWEFWKQRLGGLKDSELVTNETRELFLKALKSMAKVEAETG